MKLLKFIDVVTGTEVTLNPRLIGAIETAGRGYPTIHLMSDSTVQVEEDYNTAVAMWEDALLND